MVRYHGWYSNRARGERKKPGLVKPSAVVEESQEHTVLDGGDYRPSRVPSKTWRQLIQRVWEVHPLACPLEVRSDSVEAPFCRCSDRPLLCTCDFRFLTEPVIA